MKDFRNHRNKERGKKEERGNPYAHNRFDELFDEGLASPDGMIEVEEKSKVSQEKEIIPAGEGAEEIEKDRSRQRATLFWTR